MGNTLMKEKKRAASFFQPFVLLLLSFFSIVILFEALKDKRANFFHYACPPVWLNARKTLPSSQHKQYKIKSEKILFSLSSLECMHAGRRQKLQQKVNDQQ